MRTSLLLTAIAALLLMAPRAEAQLRFMPYIGYATNIGYDFDADDATSGFLVGLGTEFSLTPGILPVALKARPSIETAFIGGSTVAGADASQDVIKANLDLIADFSPPLAPIGVYAGAGVTYMNYSATADNSPDLDGSGFGANLLAGAHFGGGFVQPFIQGRYTIGSATPDNPQLFDAGLAGTAGDLGNSFAVQVGASIGL
ncbi:MAG: outer membrane beta-barrel protein [Rhodothermaceae bacterium]|nr:outer membrane beta-barrel protein [Rhodothermaceae bacterium]